MKLAIRLKYKSSNSENELSNSCSNLSNLLPTYQAQNSN